MPRKKKIPICELPVMKSHCKTCPFRPNEQGHWQNPQLANEVINRVLFKAQQICHANHPEETHRCRGAFDHCHTIYTRMGLSNIISEKPRKLNGDGTAFQPE